MHYEALKTTNRFSEDIDLSVDTRNCSRTQNDRRLEQATKKYTSLFRDESEYDVGPFSIMTISMERIFIDKLFAAGAYVRKAYEIMQNQYVLRNYDIIDYDKAMDALTDIYKNLLKNTSWVKYQF